MGPHLQTLALSQFRSHARARLLFDGRPVALHGPNGAGKTNLLEAVSFLSPGRGLRPCSARVRNGSGQPPGGSPSSPARKPTTESGTS